LNFKSTELCWDFTTDFLILVTKLNPFLAWLLETKKDNSEKIRLPKRSVKLNWELFVDKRPDFEGGN
jgi:hypothetical protein